MSRKTVFPAGIVYNNVVDLLAALLERISQKLKGPQLQPVPVKAKN